MKYDILSLVTPDESRQSRSDKMDKCDRRQCFRIDPDIVYTATLKHFQAVREGKESGQELLDGVETADAAKKLVADVKRLTEDDFELANRPFSQCNEETDMIRRADVLELVRHWMTRAIKVAVKKPLWLHILRRENWRLS